MNLYVEYFLLGLSLAAPIGPINLAQMERGMRSGFLSSWLLGLGSILGDMIYLMVVYLGTVHFLDLPFMKALLWSFGCFVLIYTGIESLQGANKMGSIHMMRTREPLLKSFSSGFLMSILNPLSIMFWIGIYGSVLVETTKNFNTSELLIYTSCILLGLLLWDLSMATISSQFHRFLNERVLSYISLLSGFALLIFGVYFGIEALREIMQ